MDIDLLATLEERIELMLNSHAELKKENERLKSEVSRFLDEREILRNRIDSVLGRLETI